MKKRIVSLFLAFLIGFAETAVATPVVDETLVENEDKTGGFLTIGDGFVPDKAVEETRTAGSLNLLGKPENSQYVPIEEDYIPQTLEDQEGSELCWAISQTYACEINAKKKKIINTDQSLSASHLGYFCYNLNENVADPEGNTKGEYTRAIGFEDWAKAPGNGRLSMWEAAGWIGFVGYDKATDETYSLSHCLSSSVTERADLFSNSTEEAYLMDDIHVTDVYLAGVDKDRRDDAKQLISELGAVTGGYYSNKSYDSFAQEKETEDDYETSYGTYYYDGTGNRAPNHAITIIGWDDNYKKENFVSQPSSDGAWLCMNSWGEEGEALAQDGFFWLSYEDAGLLNEGTVIGYSVEKAQDHQHIYQYDGSLGIETTEGDRFVQFFKLNGNEKIKAVSAGIGTAGANCTASLYKISGDLSSHYQDTSWVNLLKGRSGTITLGEELVAAYLGDTQASFSYEGYHTIDVSDLNVSGEEGSVIAVVMDFDDEVELYTDKAGTIQNTWKFVTADDPYQGICLDQGNASMLRKGESFRIKMFTEDLEEELTPTVAFTNGTSSISIYDSNAYLTAQAYDAPDGCAITYVCPENEYMDVDSQSGKVTQKKAGGPVKVTAQLRNAVGKEIASDTAEFFITKTVSSVEISSSATLSIGENITLTPAVVPSLTSDMEPLWYSSDLSVASVDENGTIEGIGEGTAEITCFIGDTRSNACLVTVESSYTGVKLDRNEVTINKGNLTILKASTLPEGNKDKVSYIWTSSDSDIVSVDEVGRIVAKGYGDAVITVQIAGSDYKDQCKVHVAGQLIGVELDRHETALSKGSSTRLVAQALPKDTVDTINFVWSTNKESVATVDNKGNVTGVGYGTAIITVTCGDYQDSCKVVVSGELSVLNLQPEKLLLKKGMTARLTVSLEPKELANNAVVLFTSKNGNVASVADDGTITANSEGTCEITAVSEKLAKTCTVIVDDLAIYEGTVQKSSATIEEGKTQAFRAVWKTQKSDVEAVKWTSNNASVARVNENGVVTGVHEGTALVYATSGDGVFQAALSVTVKKGTQQSVSISVQNADALRSMKVGDSAALQVFVNPAGQWNAVTYSSTDASIASVSTSGVVTALKKGTTSIVVSYGSEKKTLPVIVSDQESGGEEVVIRPDGNTIQIKNKSDFKDFKVGDKVPIVLQLVDKDAGVLSGVEFDIQADGVYAAVESGVVIAKKAGTAVLKVTAYRSGKQLCQKNVYVTITLPETIGGNAPKEEKPKETESEQPSVSENSVGEKPSVSENSGDGDDNGKTDAEEGENTESPQDVKPIYVKRITLFAETKRIAYNGVLPVRAEIFPGNADNKALIWKSSNERWASVDQNGKVTAHKDGGGKSVVITCKAADGSGTVGSYAISIKRGAVKKLKIVQPEKRKNLNVGKSMKLKVKYWFSGDDTDVCKDVVWICSNPAWASVDRSGKVTAYAAGEGHEVIVTARAKDMSGAKATYRIKIVRSVVTKIKLKPENRREVYAGDTIQLRAALRWTGRESDVDKKLKWTSSNSNWASVDETGKVTTYKVGGDHTVTITAKAASGVKGYFRIKIKASKVTKVIIKPVPSNTLKEGTKLKLTAEVKTSARKQDAKTKLKWSSSNPKVAVVSKKGMVMAKKPGRVTIYAESTDGSKRKAKIRLVIEKK